MEPGEAENGVVGEVCQRELSIEKKRFMFYLKANVRGRFLKIAEVSGSRSFIMVPKPAISALHDLVAECIESHGDNGQAPENPPETEIELLSKEVSVEQKKFFVNLKENQRGRFLKIAEVQAGQRSTIIVPSVGWVQFRDMLMELDSDDSPPVPQTFPVGGPAVVAAGAVNITAGEETELLTKEMFAEQKRFYLNLKQNTRGRFLKIVECGAPGSSNRNSIFVPESGWVDLRKLLDEVITESPNIDSSAGVIIPRNPNPNPRVFRNMRGGMRGRGGRGGFRGGRGGRGGY
eukprot:JP446491.1.p1 GENE.JP446491.1~~JP446491.1.p1  ORF type:complete len:290 (-),score=74.17 JP446491.1:154-1023(-)